jgi:hypothetical protein
MRRIALAMLLPTFALGLTACIYDGGSREQVRMSEQRRPVVKTSSVSTATNRRASRVAARTRPAQQPVVQAQDSATTGGAGGAGAGGAGAGGGGAGGGGPGGGGW